MAGDLHGLSSMATRQILADLVAAYAQRSGVHVSMVSIGGVEAAKRVRAGEALDVVVLASDAMEKLEAERHLIADSRVAIARSEIALAVPSGRPRPKIDDADAVRQAMLAARVCYSTGPSGDHLKALWDHWGIATMMTPRAIQAPPGIPVATVLARGDADLGVQQLSELLGQPGIDIVGPLPSDVQAVTTFVAGVAAASHRAEAAAAFVAFLAAPEAEDAKRRGGMAPA